MIPAGTGTAADAVVRLEEQGGQQIISWVVTPQSAAVASGVWLRFGIGGIETGASSPSVAPIDLKSSDGGLVFAGKQVVPTPVYASIASHLAAIEYEINGMVVGRGQVLPRLSSYSTVRIELSDGGTGAGGHFVIPLDGGSPIAGRSVYHLEFPAIDSPTSAEMRQGGPGGTGPVILPLTLVPAGIGNTRAIGMFDPAAVAPLNTDGGVYLDVRTSGGAFRGQLVTHH